MAKSQEELWADMQMKRYSDKKAKQAVGKNNNGQANKPTSGAGGKAKVDDRSVWQRLIDALTVG